MKFWKDKVFLKKMLLLSLPIAFQNLITSVLNIFDQIMVGWLPTNADNCLSAVLLANQIVFIYQIVLFSAANTSNIFIAQYSENGNKEKIPTCMGFLIIMSAFICAIFTTVCAVTPQTVIGLFSPNPEYFYLSSDFLGVIAFSFIPMSISVSLNFTMRGIKKMRVGLIANITGVLFNIFFNYIFMFGAFGMEPMGLMGAAYGTIISRIIEACIIFFGVILCKYPLFARPKKMFAFSKGFVIQNMKMFFPILCSEVFWVLSMTVYLFVYDKLPSSEIALAAMNIAQSVDKILSVAMIGVGSAAGIMIGNVIGQGDKGAVKDYSVKCVWFSIFTGVLIGCVTVGCAFFAPSLFANSSEQARHTAKILILLYAATAVLRNITFMAIIGVLRSGGDTTFTMVWEMVACWFISVPLVFFGGLVMQWNIYVLFLLSNVCEIAKAIIFLLRLSGDKWLRFSAEKAHLQESL